MSKKQPKILLLIGLLVAGLLVRTYKINSPIADWHSWRQADTAAVARNYLKNGIDLLYPKFDDLSSIPSGISNPKGYRFVEFPIYNLAHLEAYKISRVFNIPLNFEGSGRLTSAVFWLLGGIFLYLTVKKLTNWKTAVFSLFFFLFLPFNIFYSRTILPDPSMVFFALTSVYFLTHWQTKKELALFLFSIAFSALAVLTKPYAIFILVPSWAVIFYQEKKISKAAIMVFFSALPFLLWRYWIRQFPEGIPANKWLLNAGGMRFKPAWWRWLFYERLAKLILGGWGTGLLALGLVRKINKNILLFFGWLVGGLAYLIIFARGNIQHDYYQIILAPTVAVFLALGVDLITSLPKNLASKWKGWLAVLALTSFTMLFSGYQIKDYYQINHPEIVAAGKKADQILPAGAKVIAPYGGDTAFLYQTNRQGWPVDIYSLEEMNQLGATHYVSVNLDEQAKKLADHCQVLDKNESWIIIDLSGCENEK